MSKKIILSKFVKRDDARIYTLAYKPTPYKLPDNALHTTLHCGAALHDYHFGLPDNLGTENISALNNVYCDTSGLYWIWKNHPTTLKYIGTQQYSKWLNFKADTDFDKIFEEYNSVAVPYYCLRGGAVCSPRVQWQKWHPAEVLDLAEEYIKEHRPEYSASWDAYINQGELLYISSGVVLRTEHFEEYCELFFSMCDYITARLGATRENLFDIVKAKFDSGEWRNMFTGRPNDYMCLIYGFLNERVQTMFLRHLGKVKEVKFKYMDHV